MKNYIFTILMLLSTTSLAQTHIVTSDIAAIRTHNNDWGSHAWVQLNGVVDVADCAKGSSGGVGTLAYLVVDKSETSMFSMLLAAYMSGKNVQVQIDATPSEKINGFCVVRYATLTN